VRLNIVIMQYRGYSEPCIHTIKIFFKLIFSSIKFRFAFNESNITDV